MRSKNVSRPSLPTPEIPLDITRDDLLILLASMGVSLPKTTKIPDADLHKRVLSALDTSQQLSDLIEKLPVDPTNYPLWSSKKTLFEASQRQNMTEAICREMAHEKLGPLAPKEEVFKEMRKSIMGFAYMRDMDLYEMCFADDSEQWGILVRIFDVYKVKDDVPLFLFIYKELHATETHTLKDLQEVFRAGGDFVTLKTSDFERRALLKLFEANAKRLHPRHQAINDEGQARLLGFKSSFVLPLCPINMRDLGKLTHNPGCDVCGKKNIRRCVQCLSASYCGKECQTKDWQNHRQTCRSLKGGTWRTITFEEPPSAMPYQSIINRLDSMHNPATAGINKVTSGDKIQPDIHNGKVFLAKFQISLSHLREAADMLIYDRQRSFQAFWKRSSDRQLFDSTRNSMGGRMKFYRWARRVGDHQFEVCMDRAPEQEPVW
ncbi:hypothetical protein B0H34DRAFT_702485 [Crassisporium funariophilum]|nr:hypothetical protein B0H34DRAFT_702485 [Crassisporium funariophilum]